MERYLFTAFLLIAAAQDMERKQVDIWIYLLFGGAALAMGIGRHLAGDGTYDWLEHLWAAGLGIGLLMASAVSRGGIGVGDGCFFLVSGLYLEFRENLMLLCYGIMFCGLFSLGYLMWCRFRTSADIRKQVVPFLPFVVPTGIWLALQGWFFG